MSRSRTRAGFMLVELLVVMAILSLGLGVVAGSLVSLVSTAEDAEKWLSRLEEGRATAIRAGRPTVVWSDSAHLHQPVLFLPDGRSVGEPRGLRPTGRAP